MVNEKVGVRTDYDAFVSDVDHGKPFAWANTTADGFPARRPATIGRGTATVIATNTNANCGITRGVRRFSGKSGPLGSSFRRFQIRERRKEKFGMR